jgi:hypothetical protein
MDRTRLVAIVGAFACALAVTVDAADQPIGAAKITLLRSASGKEKLVFIAKDPSFLFPAIGSADDPGTGSPGGALFEIASTAEPSGASFLAPVGVGRPGWHSKDAPHDSHTYSNPDAAPGPTALSTVLLRQGKRIKVKARGVGLALSGPQGFVGVRITTGTLRNCVLFDGPTIKKDEAGRFIAANAVATSLGDCSNLVPPGPPTTSSSSTTVTTTTSTTSTSVIFDPCVAGSGFPTCDGSCDVDETCQATFDVFSTPSSTSCLCYPAGVTACAQSAYPSCGGACSGGGVCQAVRDVQQNFVVCGCVDPSVQCFTPAGPGSCTLGTCPPGSACLVASLPAPSCGCGVP